MGTPVSARMRILVVAVFVVASFVSYRAFAATTIGTSISTDGNATVGGTLTTTGFDCTGCVAGGELAATLSLSDGDFLDLAAVLHDDASAQGLRLPNCGASPTDITGTNEGYVCWDQSGNRLLTNDGSAWNAVGIQTGDNTTWTGTHAFNGSSVAINSGTITIGNAAGDIVTIDGTLTGTATLASNPAYATHGVGMGSTGILFEGATDNTIEVLLRASDPAIDGTFLLPDPSGAYCTTCTLATLELVQTFSAPQTFGDDISDTMRFNTSIYGGSGINLAGNPGMTGRMLTFEEGAGGSTNGGLIWEGATSDNNEGFLTAAEPTADRTWTLPDATGAVPVGTKATAALDFAAPGAVPGCSADLTITANPASDGDQVILGAPNGSVCSTCQITAWVSASNTVTVRNCQFSGGAVDPASGTFEVLVVRN